MEVRILPLVPSDDMYLYTTTDNETMKRHWHFGGKKCGWCQYRFECFTDDRVHVYPVKVDLITYPQQHDEFKAEFHLPGCLRLGLYKQIADTGYWSRSYKRDYGDGFRLGAIIEEEDEQLGICRSWIKLPNILYVTGMVKGSLWVC